LLFRYSHNWHIFHEKYYLDITSAITLQTNSKIFLSGFCYRKYFWNYFIQILPRAPAQHVQTYHKIRYEVMPTPKQMTWFKIMNDFWDLWNFPKSTGATNVKLEKILTPLNSGSKVFHLKPPFFYCSFRIGRSSL